MSEFKPVFLCTFPLLSLPPPRKKSKEPTLTSNPTVNTFFCVFQLSFWVHVAFSVFKGSSFHFIANCLEHNYFFFHGFSLSLSHLFACTNLVAEDPIHPIALVLIRVLYFLLHFFFLSVELDSQLRNGSEFYSSHN